MGMFYRTIRMVENGIKPVYVFDGKPPDMKSGEVCNKIFDHLYCSLLYVSEMLELMSLHDNSYWLYL